AEEDRRPGEPPAVAPAVAKLVVQEAPEEPFLADSGELVGGEVVGVQLLRADVVGPVDAVLAARRRPGLERERDEGRGARQEFPRERGERKVRERFLRRRSSV